MRRLRRGSRGLAVRKLQEQLTLRGHHTAADGVFGRLTDRSVRQLQAASGVRVDGVVGDRTWDVLLVESRGAPPGNQIELDKIFLSGLAKRAAGAVVRDTLLYAIDFLGAREEPPGSNQGPDIDELVAGYWAHHGVTLARSPPWCAIFVSSCIRKGVQEDAWTKTPMGGWFGAVSQYERWAKGKGLWTRIQASTSVVPGALFTMARNGGTNAHAGHMGFLIRDDGPHVVTLEGNINDGVGSRTRRKATLTGAIDWWK